MNPLDGGREAGNNDRRSSSRRRNAARTCSSRSRWQSSSTMGTKPLGRYDA